MTPARISLPNSRVMSALFESTIQAFEAVPSVIKLLLSYNQASEAITSTALCFANIFASNEVDFISQRFHLSSGSRTTDARSCFAARGSGQSNCVAVIINPGSV